MTNSQEKSILMFVNAEWYFLSHRLELAHYLQQQGFSITVAAGVEKDLGQRITEEGFRFIPIALKRRSANPLHELLTLWEIIRVIRDEKPTILHNISIKPVLYGSILARILNVPFVINTIPGLGYVERISGSRRQLLLQAYKLALSHSRLKVIFQNSEDQRLFINNAIISESKSVLVRGSGVDTELFCPDPDSKSTEPPIVLLASRMLWEKGVEQFVEAAKLLNNWDVKCRLVLVGVPDERTPGFVPHEILSSWDKSGVIEWWGFRSDMPKVLQSSSIVVLPTYYPEGVPKILIEAAACGKPIITTDVPGCRDIVIDQVNGLLIPKKDSESLAVAIKQLIDRPNFASNLGLTGRARVIESFSNDIVNYETLQVYIDLLDETDISIK